MTAHEIFSYFQDMILDFFYPPHCPVCDKYIENRADILCQECERNILFIERSPEVKAPLKEVWRISKYRDYTKNIITDLKFNNKLNQLPVINKILDKALVSEIKLENFINKIDISTAVPLHRDREEERGFNQVELIFGEWLEKQNIPMERLVLRTRSTAHLYDLNPKQRKKELDGAFALAEGLEEKIKGKKILILDDIFTTGTTMSECAKILKNNGAFEIYGLALASDFKD